MPLSDMLFANTHNVEQIVDIKHKKSVDKVLLKVVKVVRERASIPGWIKVTSDLRKEFNVTDRQMKSICGVLSSYYNVDIDPAQMTTPGDLVGLIKAHKAGLTDSLYLIDHGSVTRDEDGDLEPKENLEIKPEIIKTSEPSVPSDIPIPEKSEPSIEGGEDDEKTSTPELVGKESIFDTLIVGGGAVAAAIEIVKLYQAHNWDKLVEKMTKDYDKIITDIKRHHKDDPSFKNNRAILYNAKELKNAFAARTAQLKKLYNMPYPIIGEDPEQSKNKLQAYFKPKMDPRIRPGSPSYLTLEEAGYLNYYVTRDLIKNIKECFDLQDALDHKLMTYMRKTEGEKYKPVLEEVGVTDHFHALYKEDWTEHFSTNVMKAIVNGLNGESNKDVGSEKLEESQPTKVEASMESVTPVQTEEKATDWGSMMDSF